MTQKLEYTILDMIESASRYIKTNPLNLGGISGTNGGLGGPPGGFIGQLPQTRVAYDTDEVASSGIPASGVSLLDNLNHIRYRLGILESGGSTAMTIIDDDTALSVYPVDTIHFSGAGITVTDLGGGEVKVSVVSSGGIGNFPNPFALPEDISPAAITVSVDNYNPTGLSTADVLRLSSTGNYFLNGIQGGSDGRILILYNIGTNNIYLINESLTSSAPNRFVFGYGTGGTDFNLTPNSAIMLQYDSTSSRWRGFGTTSASLQGLPVGVSISTAIAEGETLVWDSLGNTFLNGFPLTVLDYDGTPTVSNVSRITFSGLTVTDLGSGDVLVAATSGGAGTPLTVAEVDGSPSVNNVDKIIFSGASVTDLGSGDVLVTVDNYTNIGVGRVFYLVNTLTDIIEDAAYMHELSPVKDHVGLVTQTVSSIANSEYKQIIFATYPGVPFAETIVKGMYRFYITAKQTAGTRATSLYFNLYKQDTSGTQTLLVTSARTPSLTASYVTYELAVSGGPFTLNNTDRLVLKFYVVGGASGTNATIQYQFGNTDGERLEIPACNTQADEVATTGWIRVEEVWTRTGNHTFTIPGNVTARYRKGTKVRYEDDGNAGGGSFEYGVVQSATYSSPNTTVTLITNTDYAMAAATISNTSISYIENPEGFPQTFNFTASVVNVGGTGTPTFTITATGHCYWKCQGNTVETWIRVTGTTGGTTVTSVSLALPAPDDGSLVTGAAQINDGGTIISGVFSISTGSPGSGAFRRYDSASLSIGTGRVLNGWCKFKLA